MTDWTDLPNAAVAAGGLPSGETVTALRDNPVSIAEGAAGAPQVAVSAFGKQSAGTVVQWRANEGGNVQLNRNASWTSAASLPSLRAFWSGTVRVYLDMREDGLDWFKVRMRLNGLTVDEFHKTGNTWETFSLDIAVALYDELTFEYRTDGGLSSEAPYHRNLYIATAGETILPAGAIASPWSFQ